MRYLATYYLNNDPEKKEHECIVYGYSLKEALSFYESICVDDWWILTGIKLHEIQYNSPFMLAYERSAWDTRIAYKVSNEYKHARK